MIAETINPPYYAVIFTSLKTDSEEGYQKAAEQMLELAQLQEGYLGEESARNVLGITVSYWKDEASILKWKQQTDHLLAQKMGREKWYSAYKTRVAFVERDYEFKSK